MIGGDSVKIVFKIENFLKIEKAQIDIKAVFDEVTLKKLIDYANIILANEKEIILQNIFNKDMLIGSMQLEATSIDKKYKIIKITKEITSILSKQNAHFYEVLMCILFLKKVKQEYLSMNIVLDI